MEFLLNDRRAVYAPLSGPRVECRRLDVRASWAEAAARGAVFRALGQEPGWLVTIANGRLAAELDYGQRTLAARVATRRADGGSTVWTGRAGGRLVRLTARRTPCRDAMSGHRFPLTVRLRLGDSSHRGCGRWLVPRGERP